MRYKPFLSHKREKANAVAYLKEQLCLRGAGGWKDSDDIPLGAEFGPRLVDAIERGTGGFIWWATRDTLASTTICEIELPTALDRAARDARYPVVPVFVELRPGRDTAAIEAAIGPDYAQQLIAFNGLIRVAKQPLTELAREAARRYVRQLVGTLPAGPVEVAITAFRAPTEEHHLTLDWRALFNEDSRTLASGATEIFVEALRDVREALQGREQTPRVTVEVSLPLPLAMLVGYEWRTVTQLQVTVRTVNPGGSALIVEPGPATSRSWPAARAVKLRGTGPLVLAVSIGADLGAIVDSYAEDQGARGLEHVHVELGADEFLNPDAIRSLAAHVVARMNELHAAGTPKHLLLRAPAALATSIGLAANGTGPTWLPFYDGHDGYVGGIWIG